MFQMTVMSWAFTLWLVGSLLLFLLARALGSEVDQIPMESWKYHSEVPLLNQVSFTQSVGVIGYSILPLMIGAVFLLLSPIFGSLAFLLSLSVRVGSCVWSTYSAGSLLGSDLPLGKRLMLMYPMLLLFGYFVGLQSGVQVVQMSLGINFLLYSLGLC